MFNDTFSMLRTPAILSLVLAIGLSVTSANGLTAEDELTPKLRLQYRAADQSLLYVKGDGGEDAVKAKEVCDDLKARFSSIDTLATLPLDCSALHTIIIGSNGVDFLEWNENEELKSQVLSTLQQFVGNGGHLVIFGSFNGRNTEKLKDFGFKTTHFHNDYFERVPGRTEVFFDGLESIPPSPAYVHSFGNVIVDPGREHVVMLKRGRVFDPEDRRAEFDPDAPVFVTITHQRGRVSYSPVEPHAGGPWMIPIVVNWVLRGAPTNQSQLQETVVVPSSMVRKRNHPPEPAFPEEALDRMNEALGLEFRKPMEAAKSSEQKIQLAEQILAGTHENTDSIVQYARTRMACEYLAAGGQWKRASELLDQTSNQYQFDVGDARTKLLETLLESGVNIPSSEMSEILVGWANHAAEIHQYRDAFGLIETAAAGAKADNQTDLATQLTKRLESLRPLMEAQVRLANDFEKESSDADLDRDAQTRLGKFFALTCRDWERGLPLLTKGSDKTLRVCAEQDLKGSESPATQIEIARQWRDVNSDLTEIQRRSVHERALYWYLAALPFVSGSEHQRITAEISELELTRHEIKFKLRLDGAGRLEISADAIRWIDHFGTIVTNVEVNQVAWSPQEAPVFLNAGATQYLPVGITLNRPQLRKLSGRAMAVLQRNTAGIAIIELNDVPVGDDVYEFVIDAAY